MLNDRIKYLLSENNSFKEKMHELHRAYEKEKKNTSKALDNIESLKKKLREANQVKEASENLLRKYISELTSKLEEQKIRGEELAKS